ncbi:MAG: SpoIIE family protein phosphatase, partial [Polyangiaceae bacterium]
YANAGHPPMLLAQSPHEPAKVLASGDLPLGVVNDLAPVTHKVSIPPKAVVAIYTDGIIEFARDLTTAESRLQTAIALLVGDTTLSRPAMTIKEIVLENNVPRDDAALLVMQFSTKGTDATQTQAVPLDRTWRFHSSHAFTASRMRAQIVAYLRDGAVDQGELDLAEIVVGEIVANAVSYAPGLIELSIDWSEEKPVLKVVDVGVGIEQADFHLPDDPLQEGGRGLFLIRSFADEVRIETLPSGGACLCAVLPVRRQLREGQAVALV